MAGSEWREWVIPFAPFALWLAVIMFLSSGSGSAEETSRFITPILKYFFPHATSDDILAYHLLIRKCSFHRVCGPCGVRISSVPAGTFRSGRAIRSAALCDRRRRDGFH